MKRWAGWRLGLRGWFSLNGEAVTVIGLLTKTYVFKIGQAAGIRSRMYLRGYGTLPQRSSAPRSLGR